MSEYLSKIIDCLEKIETEEKEKLQKVVDTTGAGDTFNGVLSACIASGMDLKSAVKTANVASSIKVTKMHVLDAIPTKEEIGNYIKN